MAINLKADKTVEPLEDYGFFGPDSVTWKVWSYPTSLIIGFIRAVVVEELDPALVAAVDKTRDIYKRPATRYDRTLRYFAMMAFGDSRSASQAADILVRVHSKAIGTDPYSGAEYDANDPQSQLWIHLTAWHSILYSYEKYGPGKLSAEEEAQYWRECAVAAELQTCSPDDVPRTREGIQDYFDGMRPQLAGSPIAREAMEHLLNGVAAVSPLPRFLAPATWVVNFLIRAAVIATMPRWMRELGGQRQSRFLDSAVVPLMKVSFGLIHLSRRLEIRVLGLISPSTVPVVAPMLRGVPPTHAEVVSPAEARERYGFDKPAEAHLAWRAKQRERVFGKQLPPSDDGLIESQAVLGNLG